MAASGSIISARCAISQRRGGNMPRVAARPRRSKRRKLLASRLPASAGYRTAKIIGASAGGWLKYSAKALGGGSDGGGGGGGEGEAAI